MIIDAHMHYADDDPAFLALLAAYDLKFLNICVVDAPRNDWHQDRALYQAMASSHPNRFAWCTSFDLPDFRNDQWHDDTIRQLDQDFASGAIACKVWKNVGMELCTPDGAYVIPDDPIFDPIYEHLAALKKPLLTHIAEPIACWRPATEDMPHMAYFRDNPQWHMVNFPERPSHTELMQARDNLLTRHPSLRVVGAHLASLEYDVDEVAARLDRYPNFAVDISARLVDLAVQPSPKVRDFFLRYADRILYGTDIVMRQRPSAMSESARADALARLRQVFDTHFAYFNDDKRLSVKERTVDHWTTGLKLPDDVLNRFYRQNAIEWYPGI